MRPRTGMFLLATLALASCQQAEPPANETGNMAEPSPAPSPASGWVLETGSAGAVLRFVEEGGAAAVQFFCPAAGGSLTVNVPGFRPIGSEERMTLGSGGTAVLLVADARGDAARGGVSGEGPVPPELDAILAGRPGVNYGASNAGPFAVVPAATRKAFVGACAGAVPAPSPTPSATGTACRLQDGKPLLDPVLRAIGTEPFWNAEVEGRCVTYSTPEDQAGTRVWTQFGRADGARVWSGTLNGRPFVLTVRPAPGDTCSDGMSDRRYPASAALRIGGETRHGCAEPASAPRGEAN